MKTILLSVGHLPESGGATAYNGTKEYWYNLKFANAVKKSLSDFKVKVIVDYEANLRYNLSKYEDKIDMMLSFHFNAFNGSATGSEVWYSEDSEKTLASQLSKLMSNILGVKDRGAKKEVRRFGVIRTLNKPIDLMLEPAFIDNKSDLEKVEAKFPQLVNGISEWIVSVLELSEVNYGVETLFQSIYDDLATLEALVKE